MKINEAISKYYVAFCRFRAEWDLPDDQEIAFRNIEEAYFRIENDVRANLDDVPLLDALRTAHSMLGWPDDDFPFISFERPRYRLGKFQPLNNTVILYFERLRRFRTRLSHEGNLFDRQPERLYATLHEAFRRIRKDRNAPVDDLPLLETLHKVHKLLELDPVEVPHVDVSRHYEGETRYDSMDEWDRVQDANGRKLRRPRPLALPR